MKPPDSIETTRLSLRPVHLDDAEAIFGSYAQDVETVKYLIWKPHQNIEETRTFLGLCIQNWQDGSAFPYAIVLKENNQLIGMLELRIQGHQSNLGYVLAKAFWGSGLMSEAVSAVVAWALAQPSIFRVSATCDVENVASARVLEKAGMKREGVFYRHTLHPNISPEPRDVFGYAIVKRN